MERKATKISIRHHAYINNEKGRVETYYTDSYEVGKEHMVPSGDGSDKVISLTVTDSWSPHVEVEYAEWGYQWITDYVTSVEFENEDWVDVRDARREKKKKANKGK